MGPGQRSKNDALDAAYRHLAIEGSMVRNSTPGELRLKVLLKVAPHTAWLTDSAGESMELRRVCQSLSDILSMVLRPALSQVANELPRVSIDAIRRHVVGRRGVHARNRDADVLRFADVVILVVLVARARVLTVV